MSSKELKLAAKVEKKQKRRQEKAAKKKLKIQLREEQEKKKRKEKREKKRLEKKERKRLKKLEKEQKKKQKKEQKKKEKELEEQKKLEKKRTDEKKQSDEKKREKELKKSEKSSKTKKTESLAAASTGDSFNFDSEVKKKKDKSEREKSDKKHKKDRSEREQTGSNKKPKLENVKKHISVMQPAKVDVSDKPVEPVESVKVVKVVPSIPTPSATPIPTLVQKTFNTSVNNTTATNPVPVSDVRKPVGIRKPGSNREKREINPIYTKPPVGTTALTGGSGDFIIPGVNDTEESRILTRTFADRWILPATLYKIEASTGLKYKRGRFTDAEKLLAMKLTAKFCQEQNMSMERFKTVFFDDMGTENGHSNRLSNFFVDVSQHFGGRPVVAVYDFLKRLYHPGNHRGPWTPEEDDILLREYQKHGPKWTLIGKELNRLGINCRDRYNIRWKHEGKTLSGPWSEDEDEKLRAAIKDSIEASGSISWLWISEERVKTRTPLQCLSRWKCIKTKSGDKSVDNISGNNTKNSGNKVSKTSTGKTSTSNTPKTQTWSGWKEDEDYLLIHSILTSGATSDDSIQWKNLSVTGVPAPRHNPELFFRRWNHLKAKAEVAEESLRESVEKVKRYLIKLSKSPAYIFSEDEETDI